MSRISVTIDGRRLAVRTPFEPAFVAGATALAGRWSPPHWLFDSRDEARVRKLMRECFGTDGNPADAHCTVRLELAGGHQAERDAIRIGGRELARAFGRDSGAPVREGVVLIAGGFRSGGSVQNWVTKVCDQGAVVLLQDLPERMARRLIERHEQGHELWIKSISLDLESRLSDREALLSERERLLSRLSEIDLLLQDAVPAGAGSEVSGAQTKSTETEV
ncbi:MAG: hypothetical protein QM750_19835 [Rubrivivax sp.]